MRNVTARSAPPGVPAPAAVAPEDACGLCGYWRCRCRQGSAAAVFAALYADHAARIRRVLAAGLRYGDLHQVDDLAQTVWLALWRRLDRGDVIRRPGALLTVMARHAVVDHYRLAHVRREVAVDPTGPAAAVFVAGPAGTRELVAA